MFGRAVEDKEGVSDENEQETKGNQQQDIKLKYLIFDSCYHHLGAIDVFVCFYPTNAWTTVVSASETVLSLGIFGFQEGGQEMNQVVWVPHCLVFIVQLFRRNKWDLPVLTLWVHERHPC